MFATIINGRLFTNPSLIGLAKLVKECTCSEVDLWVHCGHLYLGAYDEQRMVEVGHSDGRAVDQAAYYHISGGESRSSGLYYPETLISRLGGRYCQYITLMTSSSEPAFCAGGLEARVTEFPNKTVPM